MVLRLRSSQLGLNFLYQDIGISRFNDVIVDLQANGFKGSFECRIAGENEGYRIRLRAAQEIVRFRS